MISYAPGTRNVLTSHLSPRSGRSLRQSPEGGRGTPSKQPSQAPTFPATGQKHHRSSRRFPSVPGRIVQLPTVVFTNHKVVGPDLEEIALKIEGRKPRNINK